MIKRSMLSVLSLLLLLTVLAVGISSCTSTSGQKKATSSLTKAGLTKYRAVSLQNNMVGMVEVYNSDDVYLPGDTVWVSNTSGRVVNSQVGDDSITATQNFTKYRLLKKH